MIEFIGSSNLMIGTIDIRNIYKKLPKTKAQEDTGTLINYFADPILLSRELYRICFIIYITIKFLIQLTE